MPTRKKITPKVDSNSEIKIEKSENFNTQTSVLETLRSSINDEINNIINVLIAQLTQFEHAKKKIENDFNEKAAAQKQNEELQSFNQMMELRKKQADFDEKITVRTKEFEELKESEMSKLNAGNAEFESKKAEFQNLKIQVATFPSQLEKAVEVAKKEIAADLKKEFESDKKLAMQKAEFDLRLAQQQISALQQSLRQQEKETESHKEEKEKLMKQISELAVAVIKGKENTSQNAPDTY